MKAVQVVARNQAEFVEIAEPDEMHRTRADGAVKIVVGMPGAVSV
jgi:hypothetical protein